MIFGEKLQQLRKSKGLSQEQLAEQINVSRQSISKWELSEALPETGKIVQLSKLLQVSTDYLLQDDFDSDMNIQPISAENGDSVRKRDRIRMFYVFGLGAVAIGFTIAVVSWLRLAIYNDLFFIIQSNSIPVSIGFIVQIIGVVIFEAFSGRHIAETGHLAVRKNFYAISIWLILPFPLIYLEHVLFIYYRRPITFFSDFLYVLIPYIIICGIMTYLLKRNRRTR